MSGVGRGSSQFKNMDKFEANYNDIFKKKKPTKKNEIDKKEKTSGDKKGI